jgi:hypothetical protein
MVDTAPAVGQLAVLPKDGPVEPVAEQPPSTVTEAKSARKGSKDIDFLSKEISSDEGVPAGGIHSTTI